MRSGRRDRERILAPSEDVDAGVGELAITDVRITLAKRDDSRLKAFASMTIAGAFVVKGLRVINGDAGLFVAMPSYKDRVGDHRDVAHPINADARETVTRAVLDAYLAAAAETG